MIDPVIQQQIAETKQIKQRNAQLSAKYKKYLSRTLSELMHPTTSAPNPQHQQQPSHHTRSSSSASISTLQSRSQRERDGRGNQSSRQAQYQQHLQEQQQQQRQQQQVFETPLMSRIDQIYKNQVTLQHGQLSRDIVKNLQELDNSSAQLNHCLNRTMEKLKHSRFIDVESTDGSTANSSKSKSGPGFGPQGGSSSVFSGSGSNRVKENTRGDVGVHGHETHLKIRNLVQERVELLDQEIRILENTMKLIEKNQVKPVVKSKKSLFSL
ncbi:unnamed protein product [Ambrosiozyma monospora]|uniref:Unnamed protein product n=1 Tax=Ambrosiozyma monospora TaxID=43982 RepID=A0ACB5TEM5_AMBMO|nr:unnamed protein product [Ambrosiozyma monospora]